MTTPTVRVRIANIEHSMVSQPCPILDRTTLPRTPVIRIYGTSTEGYKACVHIHEVFPYFYVEYKGSMDPSIVTRYISKLTHSLNHALAISLRKEPFHPKSRYVRSILLTKGVHFYGYNTSYYPFLKVLLCDPSLVNRASTILQTGSVMRTVFRCFEVHLGYILQFMIDFGLYGCGWLDIGEAWLRGTVEDQDFDAARFRVSPHQKASTLPLEFDISSHQILNRHLIVYRPLPSIPLPPKSSLESETSSSGKSTIPEALVQSVRELWEDERLRRIAKGLSPSPELPTDGNGPRGKGGGWRSEERLWGDIETRIEKEKAMDSTEKEKEEDWERWVMTTFESVEGHWDKEWRKWKPAPSNPSKADVKGKKKATRQDEEDENPYESQFQFPEDDVKQEDDVDEKMMSSQQLQDWFTQAEKEERGREAEAWDEVVRLENEEFDGGADEERIGVYRSLPNTPTKPRRGLSSMQATPTSDRGSPSRHHTPTPSPDPKSRPNLNSETSRTSRMMPPPTSTEKKRKFNPFGVEEWKSPRKTRGINLFTRASPMETPPPAQAPKGVTLILSDKLPSFPTSSDRSPTPTPVAPTFVGAGRDIPSQGIALPDLPSSEAPFPDFPSSDAPLAKRAKSDSQESSGSGAFVAEEVRWSGLNSFSLEEDVVMMSSSEVGLPLSSTALVYNPPPPSVAQLISTQDEYGVLSKLHKDPFYSNVKDVPDHAREYAGRIFQLTGGTGLNTLDDWNGQTTKFNGKQRGIEKWISKRTGGWEYARVPPTTRDVQKWLEEDKTQKSAEETLRRAQLEQRSQIEGPTPPNAYGFKISQKKPVRGSSRNSGNLSVFAVELFAASRRDLLPDPQEESDQILAVFYCFQFEEGVPGEGSRRATYHHGVIAIDSPQVANGRLGNFEIDLVTTELDLINRCIDVVKECDPDILCGWDLQSSSWGYLSDRARAYGMSLSDQVSRSTTAGGRLGLTENWDLTHNSTFKVHGRHVFNLWRIMRVEQNLSSYTFENVAFHVLHRRVPRYTTATLMEWFQSEVPARTAHIFQYFQERTAMVLDILDESETITKTSEFARVFGVDFFSVLSRGSQFKVESFMFRIAKPENFVLISPSKQDVGKQNAAECIPLIMEPQSQFYKSPLVVLDFQSLYPSVMIAYNYCYSTCLGRIGLFKGQSKLGISELRNPPGLLEKLKDHIIVAPNGILYTKPTVRKSLLARMLEELLETRVMVKQAMKSAKGDKALMRLLDARQLSLKYICNVTYGYTSASFSGRMPCVEIADSIVESGRETLEKAVHLIDHTSKWGAKVVYGDTDSLFVALPGKTKAEAFQIGRDMADTITSLNPAPIKLKFEKVYFPCLLMAKKRYVGFKYENPDDVEPVFDAKGIETIRRDGIPAGQKMVETCIKILFRSQDLSAVKSYCQRSWLKLLEGRVSVQDFVFSKEVKLGSYSDRVAPPPGAMVAARHLTRDPRAEAQYGDRVPYVITRGAPGDRLVDRAFGIEDMFWKEGDGKTPRYLDAHYYILNQLVPPLCRVFDLVGADVRTWYNEMPKSTKADKPDAVVVFEDDRRAVVPAVRVGKGKIDNHFRSMNCLVCGKIADNVVCQKCRSNPSSTIHTLVSKLHLAEAQLRDTQQICASCSFSLPPSEEVRCESYDCPWLYERFKAEREVSRLKGIWRLVAEL